MVAPEPVDGGGIALLRSLQQLFDHVRRRGGDRRGPDLDRTPAQTLGHRRIAGLGIEAIDLYQMHHIDRNTPWEEVWQAMEQLVREGKILYAGSSNFAAWNMAT